MMTEARNRYEDIREFVYDCDTLYGELFSKEQIMKLIARPRDIFEAIAFGSVDLLRSGYGHDVIVSRISFFTADSIDIVARCSDVLISRGMEPETILETAAEEGGHIRLQENYKQAIYSS